MSKTPVRFCRQRGRVSPACSVRWLHSTYSEAPPSGGASLVIIARNLCFRLLYLGGLWLLLPALRHSDSLLKRFHRAEIKGHWEHAQCLVRKFDCIHNSIFLCLKNLFFPCFNFKTASRRSFHTLSKPNGLRDTLFTHFQNRLAFARPFSPPFNFKTSSRHSFHRLSKPFGPCDTLFGRF